MTCSALEGVNIDAVWDMVLDYRAAAEAEGQFTGKRSRQNLDWMRQLMHEMLLQKLSQNKKMKALLPELEAAVKRQEITAFAAVRRIMEQL